MAVQKKMFVALKKIVPSEMEYYLEELNSEGLELLPLGEAGLFRFLFTEKKPEKTKYVVDCTEMNKVSYMQTAIDKGWELTGKSFNCYIWRKKYEGQDRPEDFSDKQGLYKHCLRQGLVMTVMAFIILALIVGLVYFIRLERSYGVQQHTIAYTVMLVTQIPFLLYFAWAGRKLLFEAKRLKEVIARGIYTKRRPGSGE
ncbi:MAG: DUF2812 domain-containing protein [Lachnospiraceae bacterium]|nr:DUF2812 domain-containing protein [Lachnospiraceae bacterium]